MYYTFMYTVVHKKQDTFIFFGNPSIFARVIEKIKVSCFFMDHSVYSEKYK